MILLHCKLLPEVTWQLSWMELSWAPRFGRLIGLHDWAAPSRLLDYRVGRSYCFRALVISNVRNRTMKKDYNDGKYSQVVSNAIDMRLMDDLKWLKKMRNKELEEANLSVDEVIALTDSGFARTTTCEKLQHKGMVASLDTEEKSSETMGRKFSDPRYIRRSLYYNFEKDLPAIWDKTSR
ncbi:40S ribosomal protein S18, partial [Mucuna pruriens]